MALYYATTNNGKFVTLQKQFAEYGVDLEQAALDVPEPRIEDVHPIALEKVNQAYAALQKPVVAMDAGFYIDALNGFPKTFVNFTLKTIGVEGILNLVVNKERACSFKQCLAFLDAHHDTPKCFHAETVGSLAMEPKGSLSPIAWSDLWLIFIPEGQNKTLAEMTTDEYTAWTDTLKDKHSSSKSFASWYKKYTKTAAA